MYDEILSTARGIGIRGGFSMRPPGFYGAAKRQAARKTPVRRENGGRKVRKNSGERE